MTIVLHDHTTYHPWMRIRVTGSERGTYVKPEPSYFLNHVWGVVTAQALREEICRSRVPQTVDSRCGLGRKGLGYVI